jgi:putative endonuclease
MQSWVYILRCADGRYYVGSHRGQNPEARLADHNAGIDPKAFTFKIRPVTLVWSAEFQWVKDAIAFERQIKGWSRAKKEALMRGDWDHLQNLAKNRSGTRRP